VCACCTMCGEGGGSDSHDIWTWAPPGSARRHCLCAYRRWQSLDLTRLSAKSHRAGVFRCHIDALWAWYCVLPLSLASGDAAPGSSPRMATPCTHGSALCMPLHTRVFVQAETARVRAEAEAAQEQAEVKACRSAGLPCCMLASLVMKCTCRYHLWLLAWYLGASPTCG
jgi:hypothetical protein